MPSTIGIVASAYSVVVPDVPSTAAAYDDEVLADAPWLYWPLDEASGTTAADDSGNARTGTATASGLLGAGSAPPQGGVSADMNGTNEITGPTTSMSVTGGAIEAWIWLPSGGSGTRYMIAGPHNGSSAFALNLLLDNSGKARFYAFDTSAGVEKHATGATTIPEEEWVHLVGVWDNVKLYIYVNGTLDGSVGSTAPEVGARAFRVARTMAPSGVSYGAFPGDVAYVAVYSAELTPARIATHYLAGLGTFTVYDDEVLADEPLGYWPMNETSGTTITDLAGYGNDGTYVNSPTLNDTAPGAGLEASVDFDGSADAGSIAVDLSAYTTATVEMWLRWDTYANNDDFAMEFTANVSSNNGSFWIDPNAADGTIQVNMKGSGGFSTTGFSRSHVPAGTWAHLAFILDRNNSAGLGRARMFVNGVEKASASVTNSNNAGAFTNSTLYLMSRATTTLYGDGGMAALAIYPAALTAGRIVAHYLAGIDEFTAYAAEVRADEPLGYWPLDEASGTTAYDLSGNGNDGTYNGSPSLSSRTLTGASGLTADVADFDGTDDYVSVPYDAALDIQGDLTLEMWVIADSNNIGLIGGNFDDGDGSTNVSYATGRRNSVSSWRFWWEDTSSGGNNEVGAGTFSNDELHHLVITRTGTTGTGNLLFYVDGVLNYTSSISDAADVMDSLALWIGRTDDATGSLQYMDGALGHVAVYDTVLSAARVAAHYQAGTGTLNAYKTEVLVDAPVGYWPLDEASGTTAADRSGNGNDATYSGSGITYEETGPSVAIAVGITTDGSAGHFLAPDLSASLGTTQAQTLELWVETPAVTSATARAVTIGTDSGAQSEANIPLIVGIGSGALSGETFSMANDAGGADDRTGWTDEVDAGWHHVVLTYDGSQNGWTLYVDGANLGAPDDDASGGAFGFGPDPFMLGARVTSSTYERDAVTVSSFAVYDTVLSPVRVAAHYLAGLELYYDDVVTAEPDVVAYWPLDEAAEPYLDRVASYDLSDGAGTPVPSSVATPVGTDSIDFTNANVTVTSNLGLTAYPFTFEAWVRQDAAGSGAAIHLGSDGGSNGVSWGHGNTTLDGTANNNIIALIDAVGWKSLSPTALASDEWVHVCVVFGTSNVYVYKNGVLGTSVATSAMNAPSAEFYIGGYSTSGRWFDGKIGQVSVYDTEFTATQAMLHYAAGLRGLRA